MRTKTNTKRKSKAGHGKPTFVGEHLVVDPRVCHGELTFRGTARSRGNNPGLPGQGIYFGLPAEKLAGGFRCGDPGSG